MRSFFARLRCRFREERGASLVEVMVSAVLLVVAGGGLLTAIDAAGKQSGEQRHQAVAADLAQTEMERLTGLRFTDVETLNVDQTKRVGETDYTIASRATWALQTPTGPATCSISGRSPEALKLTSTVTWPNMNRKPVVVTSMRAAPTSASTGKGNFVVQITNRNGDGVAGIVVAMAGASPMSGATDASGCIRFNEMTAGTYTLSFNGGGKITPAGLPAVSEQQDVVGGQTRSAIYEIDTPGALTITQFRYHNGSTNVTSTRPDQVSLAHASMPSPIVAAVTAVPWTKTGLYPFSSAYGVYAGGCTAAAPPGSGMLNATISPNTTTSTTLNMPGLNIEPDDAFTGDDVYVKTICGNILGPRDLDSSQRLRDGYPYAGSQITVCVIRAGSNPKRWIDRNTTNTNFSGLTDVLDDGSNTFDMDNYSTSTPVCGWSGFTP